MQALVGDAGVPGTCSRYPVAGQNARWWLLATSTGSKPHRNTGIALGVTLSLLWKREPRDADIVRLTVPALETRAQRAPWRTAAAGHHLDSQRPDTHFECSTGNWWSANRASALISGEQTHMLPSRHKVQRIGCAHGLSALSASTHCGGCQAETRIANRQQRTPCMITKERGGSQDIS